MSHSLWPLGPDTHSVQCRKSIPAFEEVIIIESSLTMEVSLWKQRKRNLRHSVKSSGVWEKEVGEGMLLEDNRPDQGQPDVEGE